MGKNETDETAPIAQRRDRLRKEVDDALMRAGWRINETPMTLHEREGWRDLLIDVQLAISAEREDVDASVAPQPSAWGEAIDRARSLGCNTPSPDGMPCWKLRNHVGPHEAATGEPYLGELRAMSGVVALDFSDVDDQQPIGEALEIAARVGEG